MTNLAISQHWIDLAENRAESMHNPKLFIGAGLGGALVLGSLLNPVTALLALAWGVYCAWNANECNSDQIEAVEQGILAHLLDRKLLREYASEVGIERVQQELTVALARELTLSGAAETAAKRLKIDTQAKPETLPVTPSSLLPASSTVRPTNTGTIGAQTRLNALEVSASSAIAPQTIADDLGSQVQNSLIIGKPGSGKGILLSNALRVVRACQPKTQIYVIDPKGDPLEQPYWKGCHCVASKPCGGLMPLDVWEWVQSCIREFQLMSGPKLLVIDELRYLSNTFARCNDKQTKALDTFWYIIESFTSLGDAQGSHIWGVSQSSHTSDLKISGGTLGQFRVVALVNTVDFGFYDTLCATNIVQKHPEPGHLRDAVAAQSPVHRVYYDSKFRKWFPLPAMKNFSGRDRDKGVEEQVTIAQPQTGYLSKTAIEKAQDTKPLPERIVDYLGKASEALPAWKIRNGCTNSSAPNRETTEQVKDALSLLASEGKVKRIECDGKELWQL